MCELLSLHSGFNDTLADVTYICAERSINIFIRRLTLTDLTSDLNNRLPFVAVNKEQTSRVGLLAFRKFY
jgi:hypothetical protein